MRNKESSQWHRSGRPAAVFVAVAVLCIVAAGLATRLPRLAPAMLAANPAASLEPVALAAQAFRSAEHDYVLAAGTAERATLEHQFARLRAVWSQQELHFAAAGLSPAEAAGYADYQRARDSFLRSHDQLLALVHSQGSATTAGRDFLGAASGGAFDSLQAAFVQLSELRLQRQLQAHASAEAASRRLRNHLLAAGLGVALLAALLSLWVARRRAQWPQPKAAGATTAATPLGAGPVGAPATAPALLAGPTDAEAQPREFAADDAHAVEVLSRMRSLQARALKALSPKVSAATHLAERAARNRPQ
jgi:hypothetical protein